MLRGERANVFAARASDGERSIPGRSVGSRFVRASEKAEGRSYERDRFDCDRTNPRLGDAPIVSSKTHPRDRRSKCTRPNSNWRAEARKLARRREALFVARIRDVPLISSY